MRLAYALAETVWRTLRGPLRAVFGEERLGRMLDALGLRAFKTRNFVLSRTLPDGAVVAYRPQDQCIVDEVYLERAYGDATLYKPGETVVDLGGHIGTFAVFAAKVVGPTGKVVVCEPGPANAALLEENLARNGLTWARLHRVAVSDAPGELTLYVAESAADNPAANTIFPTAGRAEVKVRARTLDDLASFEKLSTIDHLKIDIEGAELQALRGGAQALALTKRVIMEVHPERVEPQQVLDLLTAAGFAPKVLSKKAGSWLVEARR